MNLTELLSEYDRARAYTSALSDDLTDEEANWRPEADASAIGWHLGHQAAVAHYMVRNLMAAEPRLDPELDDLMDSATSEPDRGLLPERGRLVDYRTAVAERVHYRVGDIDAGRVGAPAQLRLIATTLLVAVINHEYQHSTWIGEVRELAHGKALPPPPVSDHLTEVDGYFILQ